jgi:diguanylate cyclase (GGDEF)-like protein/PAS domain S-box-containing protein
MERRFLNAPFPAKSFSSFRNALRTRMAPLAAFFLYFLHPALLLAGTTALTPDILQLKWKHQFQFAGFYAAIEKGYYRDAGLMVTFREAVQGADPTVAVLNGEVDAVSVNSTTEPSQLDIFLKGFLYSGEQPRFLGWLYGTLAGALAVIVAVSAVAIRFHYLNVALNDQMQLRDKAEEKLRKLSAAINQSPVSIIITDTSGVIEYVNPKFCELTGYAAEEVVGQNSRILRGSIQTPEFYGNLWQTILSGGLWHGEFLNKKKNDELFWEHATIAPIWNAHGELTNFIAIKEDITERKMLQEKLDHMAHHDELTGLPNRALFFDRIGQALAHAKRNDTGFALMFVDLDGFKDINDTYGHDSGDLLLQETARRLAGCIRDSDTVARMGGDEFAVMLLDVATPGQIHQVADKMLALLAAPFLLKGAECHVGASIGISVFPQDGDAVDTLMNMADMAMYRVKQGAKNNYAFAS